MENVSVSTIQDLDSLPNALTKQAFTCLITCGYTEKK